MTDTSSFTESQDACRNESRGWIMSNNTDGSKQLDRDAVIGQVTAFLLTVGATAGLGALGQLDLTNVPGWLQGAAVLAVTTMTGLLTTYLAKKRVAG